MMMLSSSSSSSQAAASGGLNTITPCAACKLLRRRCAAQECPFSPYFSPLEPHKFAYVHKVFGASNVSKMLMEVGESQRWDAANSLVYEASVRLRDPVHGCVGAISLLQHQIHSLESELTALRAEILHHRYSREADVTSTTASLIINPPPPPPPDFSHTISNSDHTDARGRGTVLCLPLVTLSTASSSSSSPSPSMYGNRYGSISNNDQNISYFG
ncbi:LOB domain-containing protein 13 [Linum grandiflorum]